MDLVARETKDASKTERSTIEILTMAQKYDTDRRRKKLTIALCAESIWLHRGEYHTDYTL